jgi:hypothetical protein
MRKVSAYTGVALAALFSAVPGAHAASPVPNNFDVTVNLNSQCEATNDGSQTVDFGDYDAFQVAAKPQTTSALLNFKCTRGFFGIPTVTFDTVNGTAAGVGVLVGLRYTLTSTPGLVAGGAPETGTLDGTADTRTYTITGSIDGGQAGACGAASCVGTHTRQLILTY